MPSLSSLVRTRRSKDRDTLADHINAAKPSCRGTWPTLLTEFTPRRPITPSGAPFAATSQSKSPLLSLPVEIRLQIWSLVARPSRSITLGGGMMARQRLDPSLLTAEDDVRGWETALLCTCKQIYAELLPVLMAVVKIRTLVPAVMIRLPELVPPSRLDTLKNVEFVWPISNPSFVGSPIKDPPKRMKLWCGTRSERAEDTALQLRAICSVLQSLPGLALLRWTFWLLSCTKRRWDAVEAGIFDEINRARQGRRGWTVEVYSGRDSAEGKSELDLDGLTFLK